MWHLLRTGAFVAAAVILTFGICDSCNAVKRLAARWIGKAESAELLDAFAQTQWVGKSVMIL
jgi:hypothetical protein